MTLQQIIEAIDQLPPDELAQLKAHMVVQDITSTSEPVSNDLERMSGLFHSEVGDVSVHAREYLQDILGSHDRSD